MKLNYFKSEFKEFFNSFKLKFNFLQIILFDLTFYAAVFLTSIVSTKIMEAKGTGLDTSMLTEQALTAASEAELAVFASGFKGFIIAAFAVIIIMALVVLLGWSLTRGLIYTNLLKKKLTKTYFIKSVGLNIVLAIIVFVVMMFISVLLQMQIQAIIYFSALLLGSIIYFISLIYIQFTKTLKVFESIGEGLSFGTKKFHKLLMTVVLILIVGAILNYLVSFLPYSIFLIMIFFIVYLAWAKTYFVNTVSRV